MSFIPPQDSPEQGSVAEVIVDVAAAGVDKPLDYLIPPELQARLTVGHRVLVPLRGQQVEGFVVGRRGYSLREQLRPIIGLLDERPVLNECDIQLAEWLSRRFLFLRVDALRCLLPPHSRLKLKGRLRSRPTFRYRMASVEDAFWQGQLLEKTRRAPGQARLMTLLGEHPGRVWSREELLAQAGVSDAVLRALVQQGLLVRVPEREGEWADPQSPQGAVSSTAASPVRGTFQGPPLTVEQQQALDMICGQLFGSQPPRPVLLQGVTGSGKTEVYMQAAARVLEAGYQALVLVPEIALTPQTAGRFRERFGGRVALWHSRLAPGERLREWWRIRRGEAPLVVGTRSAVFAPLQRLRLVIIDEEHEPSYKQEESPRYHARDVAWERARRSGALLVLGSATPSVETYQRALEGELLHVSLTRRIHGRPLPPMELVDMREEMRQGNRSILSERLREALEQVLSESQQAVLFINRRGYSTFVLCRECGCVLQCRDCSVSLTYHAEDDRLRCHYCGHAQTPPSACPQCGSRLLRRFGAGTQRVEEAVRAAFPGAKVLRLDVDTTRRKGDAERILRAFHQREAHVLIGTQMVAKGHDFPGVSLVGVIAADSGLYLPDFRAAERTFQLLTQVGGRAGRAEVEGRVIVQTYNPDHYSIRSALAYDYPGFFEREVRFRRAGGYPPFRHLARLLFTGPDVRRLQQVAVEARRRASRELAGLKVDVLGPAPAPLSRLKAHHRWHLLIKGTDSEGVREAARVLRDVAWASLPSGVTVAVDIDPVSVM